MIFLVRKPQFKVCIILYIMMIMMIIMYSWLTVCQKIFQAVDTLKPKIYHTKIWSVLHSTQRYWSKISTFIYRIVLKISTPYLFIIGYLSITLMITSYWNGFQFSEECCRTSWKHFLWNLREPCDKDEKTKTLDYQKCLISILIYCYKCT